MGKRKTSIEMLLTRCDSELARIEKEYTDSLHQQQVRSDLQIDIKNPCENLRSVLDYIADDIRETHCPADRRRHNGTRPSGVAPNPKLVTVEERQDIGCHRTPPCRASITWYPGPGSARPHGVSAYIERRLPHGLLCRAPGNPT